MEEAFYSLLTTIREKCRRDGWYGPDLLSPRRYDGALEADPTFDRATLDQLDPRDPACFGFLFPPASREELVETERQLGFALSPLLRIVYGDLANGGFGPGLGLRGAVHGYKGPYPHDDGSLVGSYPGHLSPDRPTHFIELADCDDVTLLSRDAWPRTLLPICDVGCCIEICLTPDQQIYSLAPSKENDRSILRKPGWTLEEWLWRWLKAENYCWP